MQSSHYGISARNRRRAPVKGMSDGRREVGGEGADREKEKEKEKERKREREKEREIEGRKGNRIITQRSAEEIHKNGCQRNEATPDETTVKKNQSIN